MAIPIFLIIHWYVSLFFQTFFHHRYSAHRMFKLTKFWERFFFLCAYITQGASFLNPRTYAILHRMHHTYSDTDKDPHSPVASKNFWDMMWRTKKVYSDIYDKKYKVEEQFLGGYPEWKGLEQFAESWLSRILWMAVYTAMYFWLAPNYWWFLLLPVHFALLPIQGAIVNWFGHMHGYTNFDNHDNSKNSLAVDFLMMGELFQNNHHKFPLKPNFGVKWFEFDPTFIFMRLFNFLGMIKMKVGLKKKQAQPAVVPAGEPAKVTSR